MASAKIIILPVVRIERAPAQIAEGCDRRNVIDINAFRYVRDRRLQERRAASSLIGDAAAP